MNRESGGGFIYIFIVVLVVAGMVVIGVTMINKIQNSQEIREAKSYYSTDGFQ